MRWIRIHLLRFYYRRKLRRSILELFSAIRDLDWDALPLEFQVILYAPTMLCLTAACYTYQLIGGDILKLLKGGPTGDGDESSLNKSHRIPKRYSAV